MPLSILVILVLLVKKNVGCNLLRSKHGTYYYWETARWNLLKMCKELAKTTIIRYFIYEFSTKAKGSYIKYVGEETG